MRDYQLISPSLEGILSHSSILYEGISRPIEIMRVLDGPASKRGDKPASEAEQKILSQYFQDLYGVFQKKLSSFVHESADAPDDPIKLQAILQEMIKVKRLMSVKDIE